MDKSLKVSNDSSIVNLQSSTKNSQENKTSTFDSVLKNASEKDSSKNRNSTKVKNAGKNVLNSKTIKNDSKDTSKKVSTDSNKKIKYYQNTDKKTLKAASKLDEDVVLETINDDIDDNVKDILQLILNLINNNDIKEIIKNADGNTENITEALLNMDSMSFKKLIGSILDDNKLSDFKEENINKLFNVKDDMDSKLSSIEEKIQNVLFNSNSYDNNLYNSQDEKISQISKLEDLLINIKSNLINVQNKVSNEDNTKLTEIIDAISDKIEQVDMMKEKFINKTNTKTFIDTDSKNNIIQSTADNDLTSTNNSSKNDESSLNDNTNDNNGISLDEDTKVLEKCIDNKEDNKFASIANRVSSFRDIKGSSDVHNIHTVNKSTINEDLIKTVKFMQTSTMKELTVKVNPGNLGEIVIKMVSEGDMLKAHINVSNKETYSLINSQEIKMALNNENIKVSEVNISLYNEDTTFFREGSEFSGEMSKHNNQKNNRNKNNIGELSIEDDEFLNDERPEITRLNIFV